MVFYFIPYQIMSSHEGHILRIARARQDHSPQSMFYSSAPSSEKQYRTTVLRVCSTVLFPLQRSNTRPQCPEHTVLSPLQRSQTGPQSPEHGPQICPLFREARQDHSPQSMVYRSAPSSEKPDRTTVPRAWSTDLPPLQRSKTVQQSPGHGLQFCPSSEKPDGSSGPMGQRRKNSCGATWRTF